MTCSQVNNAKNYGVDGSQNRSLLTLPITSVQRPNGSAIKYTNNESEVDITAGQISSMTLDVFGRDKSGAVMTNTDGSTTKVASVLLECYILKG